MTDLEQIRALLERAGLQYHEYSGTDGTPILELHNSGDVCIYFNTDASLNGISTDR